MLKAEEKRVLIFGATKDQGRNTRNSTFPSKDLAQIICIGGAGLEGEDDTASQEESEFTLPMRNLGKIHPRKTSSEEISGSSISMALAPGLGALLLHCGELTACKLGRRALRKKETMIRIFKTMTENKDRTRQSRYVAAQNYFARDFEKMDTADGLNQLSNIFVGIPTVRIGPFDKPSSK